MKFQAKQFCSGYMWFEFEAKDRDEAEKLIAEHNSCESDEASNLLTKVGFDADYASEVRVVG